MHLWTLWSGILISKGDQSYNNNGESHREVFYVVVVNSVTAAAVFREMLLVSLLVTATFGISPVHLCSAPFNVQIGGFCMHFTPANKTYTFCQANEYCRSIGGELVMGEWFSQSIYPTKEYIFPSLGLLEPRSCHPKLYFNIQCCCNMQCGSSAPHSTTFRSLVRSVLATKEHS